jgi:hypothetical protein
MEIIIPGFWNTVFMHVTFSKLILIKQMFQILKILPDIVSVISCYFIEDDSDDYVVKLCNYINIVYSKLQVPIIKPNVYL